tara:strand:- start:84 stop:806 length:723 start_codon:yes stop_codon:yes gene_type:complete
MSESVNPSVAVILPTYNESQNLSILIPIIFSVLEKYSPEIIVVDDASPDGTAAVVENFQFAYPNLKLLNRPCKNGLSSAVFDGCDASTANVVVVMDSDLSHDPQEIPGMIAKIVEGFDVVIGSRFVQGSAFENQPWIRLQISKIFNLVARIGFGLNYHDLLTGFAVCRREKIVRMPTRFSSPGFKWLLELLAIQSSLKVYEWPVTFHERNSGTSKANIGEVIAFFKLCLKLKLWKRSNRY